MPLIVEDGTGLADAEALIGEAELRTFAESHGLTLFGDPATAAVEAALRRGQTWVDGQEARFPGNRTFAERQALGFPRTYVDRSGVGRSAHIPREARHAVAFAALAYLTPDAPARTSPTTSADGLKSEEETVGELTIKRTYAASIEAPGRNFGDAVAAVARIAALTPRLGGTRMLQAW